MKKKTGISKILLSLMLSASFFAFTGCPQFDRDIDPDYQLIKPKEKKSGKSGKSGKDTPADKPVINGAVLAIDKAIMASNEKLYATGTTPSSSSKNILYVILPDAAKADDIAKAAEFDDAVVLVKEITTGELLVATSQKIYKFTLETGELSESPFVSFDEGKILDVISYDRNLLVITADSSNKTAWTFVDGFGAKTSVDFPKVMGNDVTVSAGKDYMRVSGQPVVIFCNDSSLPVLAAVIFDFTNSSSPKGYYQEAQNKFAGAFKSPLKMLGDTKLISSDGITFKIDISVKSGETMLKAKWCDTPANPDYNLSYDFLYTDEFKYIWFAKNNANGCTFERRGLDYYKAIYPGANKTYSGEKAVAINYVYSKFSDSKIVKKTYLVTNTVANNCVNFHVAQDEVAADE